MDGPMLRVVSSIGLSMVIFVVIPILAKPIIWPTIITFPWKADDDKNKNKNNSNNTQKEQRTVVFAGSYNPPHRGHLAMLEYLSQRYEKVIAVVGFNPNKKYAVSPEQRKTLLTEMLKGTTAEANVKVEVVQGYIWRYAKRHNGSLFFRGIRSWEKDGSDERALQILNTWGPILLGPLVWPIPTMYLEGNPKYNHVSSTLIRNLCQKQPTDTTSTSTNNNKNCNDNNDALRELVPDHVINMVADFYGPKKEE